MKRNASRRCCATRPTLGARSRPRESGRGRYRTCDLLLVRHPQLNAVLPSTYLRINVSRTDPVIDCKAHLSIGILKEHRERDRSDVGYGLIVQESQWIRLVQQSPSSHD